jgi:hypothetical protein
MKGNHYWDIDNRIEIVRKVMLTAKNYPEAIKILKTKYNIITDSNTFPVICRQYNIPRPLISANWGGDRFGKKREKK